MKRIILLGILGLAVLGMSVSPIQADFIQCVALICNGTDFDNIINGTANSEVVNARAGNDVVFLGPEDDEGRGNDGNNLIFGGEGSDRLSGGDHEDVLLPGPDRPGAGQYVAGNPGQDMVNVFAGEISECLVIFPGSDIDTINLIGFGPYSGQSPFDQVLDGVEWLHVIDPIAGGDIFVELFETEFDVVNGLPSPNVTIIPSNGGFPEPVQNCLDSVIDLDP